MKKILSCAVLGLLLAGAAIADDHNFISFNGENGPYYDINLIGEIKFADKPTTVQTYNFALKQYVDTVVMVKSIVVYDKEGNIMGNQAPPTDYKEEPFKSVEAGTEHALFKMFVEDNIEFKIEADGMTTTEDMKEDYPFKNLPIYKGLKGFDWIKEGTHVKITATCPYCKPYAYICTLTNPDESPEIDLETVEIEPGTTTFTMPYVPMGFQIWHQLNCWHAISSHAVDDLLSQFLSQWSLGSHYGRVDGIYFGGGIADVMKLYGDHHSQDVIPDKYFTIAKNKETLRELYTDGKKYPSVLGWNYLYDLIQGQSIQLLPDSTKIILVQSGANLLLKKAEKCKTLYPDQKAETDRWEALAKFTRATAYFYLMQIYGPRWEDSDNGNAKCVPIRTIGEYDKEKWDNYNNLVMPRATWNYPLASVNEIKQLIYSDLADCIEYFSQNTSTQDVKGPNLDAARGLMARTAAWCHDWQKALEYSRMAMQQHPVMTGHEYTSKSFTEDPTASYIWSTPDDPEEKYFAYYWSHGSKHACNGPYIRVWDISPGAINYDLARQIPDGDVRKLCYLIPDNYTSNDIRKKFWNSDYIDKTVYSDSIQQRAIFFTDYNMKKILFAHADKYYNSMEKMTAWDHLIPYNPDNTESNPVFPFGGQLKFWSLNEYGSNAFPLMRASEMLLLMAESSLELGNETQAREYINQLVAQRDGTPTAASGTELRDFIRLQRRMELWGEGQSWFDFKRWNLPIEYNEWKAGDPTSGNVSKQFKDTYSVGTDFANGWRYAIPNMEREWNDALPNPE